MSSSSTDTRPPPDPQSRTPLNLTVPARSILVPLHMAKHPLGAPGPRIVDLFRQLPAVLALRATQQGFKIEPRLPPRLRANKQTPKSLLQDIEVIAPRQHTVCDQRSLPSSKPSNM